MDKFSGYGLIELLKDVTNPVGIEIGCSEGNTTEPLLKQIPNLTLYSIDPYIDYVDWNGRFLNEAEELYQRTMERLRPYGNNFIMIRETSDDAVSKFVDDAYDFIFIDGLHTYEQVLLDCQNYYSKIRKGGIFAGHDYDAIEGVRQAVDKFASSVGAKILKTEVDVWYWIK
jgi:predicted O-methyltransferase YrrM